MTTATHPQQQSPRDNRINQIAQAVRAIPDFPKPGILFRDMMPVLKDAQLFQSLVDIFYQGLKDKNIQYVIGIESRGFILGAPLAAKLGAGFVPVRKIGKLPGLVEKHEYELEYGSDTVEMQQDAIEPGARVVLIDDLLATGGTAGAAAKLIETLKGELAEILFLIELDFLEGRQKLPEGVPVTTLIHY
ncbi:MAG: adenine phosphoribosyltransferase [Vampirovibrionales bacterium]|nr:adenine phosphoribosyltransferase [Vampirovibrionales bacterium]